MDVLFHSLAMCNAGHCVPCNRDPLPTVSGAPPARGQLFVHRTAPSTAIRTPSTGTGLCFQTTGSGADSFRVRCLAAGATAAAASAFRRGACHVRGLAHKSQPRPALPSQKQRGGLIAPEALKARRLLPFSYASHAISLPLCVCSACFFFFLVTY